MFHPSTFNIPINTYELSPHTVLHDRTWKATSGVKDNDHSPLHLPFYEQQALE